MKKKLEAELTSLAHGILQMKNREDIVKLRTEAQQLYEKLQVLAFIEEHFADVKPTAGIGAYQEKLEEVVKGVEKEEGLEQTDLNLAIEEIRKKNARAYDNYKNKDHTAETDAPQVKPPPEATPTKPSIKEQVADPLNEGKGKTAAPPPSSRSPKESSSEEAHVFRGKQEQKQQSQDKETTSKKGEDDFSDYDEMPVFERKINQVHDRPTSLNQRLANTSKIGMNERLGYIRHLFQGKSEDYERVMSQLNTKESSNEAIQFIDQMVKPEYDNWQGKETYEEKFKELISARFE